MPDPRFHSKSKNFSLGELADLVGGQLADESAASVMIEDLAPLSSAGAGHLTFLDNKKYVEDFKQTKATACICNEDMVKHAPEDLHLLISKNPYKSYALAAQAFYPCQQEESISLHAVIEEGVKLGKNCIIEACAVIDRNVVIGDNTHIGANATISHAIIGSNVRIYPGARIGQDGFGFAIDPAGHVKVPQLGRVIIEDHVEIGANACIDRGAGPDTVIGAGTWIDNLVQIGHNVKIGKGCILISQSGVAGSATMGDFSVLAAQAGIAGHLNIGMGAQIGAQCGVMRDVPAGEKVVGSPALPIREFMKQVAFLKKATTK